MIRALFTAFALVSIGCSSSDDGAADPADGGTVDANAGASGPAKTTGKTCTTDQECDPARDGSSACSNSAFGDDTIYPDPVCIARACETSMVTPDGVVRCDGDTGICVGTDSGSICLPGCTFDDKSVTGCGAKNGCVPLTATATGGVGYCYGGCSSDADCTGGNVCQTETMKCVAEKDVYSKTVGMACADDDEIPDEATTNCDCLENKDSLAGYCVKVCRVGAAGACPTGFTCDAQLKSPSLAAQPPGLVGTCLADCTTDADCTSRNAHCVEHAGVGHKTCTP